MILAGIVALASALVCAGCGASEPDRTYVAGAPSGVPTVEVARGDITAVVTLASVVIASPRFTITAPVSGRLSESLGLGSGTAVRANRIATVAGNTAGPDIRGVFERWLVPDGAYVAKGLPLAVLQYVGFALESQMPPDLAYRIFSSHVEIRGELWDGPGGFGCDPLDSAAVPHAPSPDVGGVAPAGDGPPLLCAIPRDVWAVAGLNAWLGITSGEAHDVLTLPLSSVAGGAQAGTVWLIGAHDTAHLRRVRLGLTDGANVEILSGLKAGDKVSTVAPDADYYSG